MSKHDSSSHEPLAPHDARAALKTHVEKLRDDWGLHSVWSIAGSGEAGDAQPELRDPREDNPLAEAAAESTFEAKQAMLAALAQDVAACEACQLARARTHVVPGEGHPDARILFIGEAPGFDEDRLGRPFVGKAGQLLTAIIEKGMGLGREDVYIGNTLKCRPPNNRDPEPDELNACDPFLRRQLDIIDPELIVTLGRFASSRILGMEMSMGAMRGRVWQRFGRKVVATYHPSYLLRRPEEKAKCWKDIQLAMREIGLHGPARGAGT